MRDDEDSVLQTNRPDEHQGCDYARDRRRHATPQNAISSSPHGGSVLQGAYRRQVPGEGTGSRHVAVQVNDEQREQRCGHE